MKIRTKLTIFFSVILFVMMMALTVWYQYRHYYFVKTEIDKKLDMLSQKLIDRIKFEKNDLFRNFMDMPPDFKDFKGKPDFKDIRGKPDFSKIDPPLDKVINNYTWYTVYDDNLKALETTNLSLKYPLDNVKSFIGRKYFITKLRLDPDYFRQHELNFFREINFIMGLGFYPENGNYNFFCMGKSTPFQFENKTNYLVILLPVNKYKSYFEKTIINAVFSLLFLIWIIIMLGSFYSKYTLEPINKIINDLNNISENSLSGRIGLNKNNKDEISAISASINNLLARIENAFNMEKQFISDVSHEFKTPIAILQLNIDNISNNPNLTDEDIDKITSSLEILYSLDTLIQKLLYLSRLESDQKIFVPKDINLKELLDSIINNLAVTADLKGLKLVFTMEDQNLSVKGDRDLLYFSFYNIIENAVKYTIKGHVSVLVERKEGDARIMVEDTGIGIPENKINKVFDKFYRVDSARNDGKSFGIGLSIAKRILDLHHAAVSIESIENQGTKFIIDFPYK